MDKQEARMQAMQRGREASIIGGLIGPYLNDKVTIIISRMASSYRSGQIDYTTLLGAAAQVTLCLDIISDLESRGRQAETATQEELNGPKPSQ